MKGKIISIATHKGGVGKSTTSINLSHALARSGHKVLVIDMDLQCNTTLTLYGNDRPKSSMYDLLNTDGETPLLSNVIYSTDFENLSVVPMTKDTATLERGLITAKDNQGLYIFKERFRNQAIELFDFIVIDCPPSLGSFTLSALIASDCVIVPNEVGSRNSIDGIREAIAFIEDINQSLSSNVKFLKVLLTKADIRTNVHRATIEAAKSIYKDRLFKTIIPSNTDIQKAEMERTTIFKFRSNASSAIAYKKLAEELIGVC